MTIIECIELLYKSTLDASATWQLPFKLFIEYGVYIQNFSSEYDQLVFLLFLPLEFYFNE